MHRSTHSLSLHFTKQIATLLRGIFIIPKIGFGKIDFFSFHTATKEKKQKNVALLEQIFLRCWDWTVTYC